MHAWLCTCLDLFVDAAHVGLRAKVEQRKRITLSAEDQDGVEEIRFIYVHTDKVQRLIDI